MEQEQAPPTHPAHTTLYSLSLSSASHLPLYILCYSQCLLQTVLNLPSPLQSLHMTRYITITMLNSFHCLSLPADDRLRDYLGFVFIINLFSIILEHLTKSAWLGPPSLSFLCTANYTNWKAQIIFCSGEGFNKDLDLNIIPFNSNIIITIYSFPILYLHRWKCSIIKRCWIWAE